MIEKEKIATILIDFDNLFKKRIHEYLPNEFERTFKNIVGEIIRKDETIEKIIIRLYGGWFTGTELNNKASEILRIITNISVFPYVNLSKMKRVNGSIDLAFSLFSLPDFKWKNTRQEKKGLPNLRINSDALTETCLNNKEHCPIKIMQKFTKKKGKFCSVESCSNRNEDVFISFQQKMVDTMLACDLITFAEKENYSEIILISDDTDFLPSLALSSTKICSEQNITMAMKNEFNFENYNSILAQFGVNVKLHEYDY